MGIVALLRRRRRERAYRHFHASCDSLGIPADVRQRALKAYTWDGGLPKPVDWYAGRSG